MLDPAGCMPQGETLERLFENVPTRSAWDAMRHACDELGWRLHTVSAGRNGAIEARVRRLGFAQYETITARWER